MSIIMPEKTTSLKELTSFMEKTGNVRDTNANIIKNKCHKYRKEQTKWSGVSNISSIGNISWGAEHSCNIN